MADLIRVLIFQEDRERLAELLEALHWELASVLRACAPGGDG